MALYILLCMYVLYIAARIRSAQYVVCAYCYKHRTRTCTLEWRYDFYAV
jgi:hypothetical protein